jgi:hypothetical protein
MVRKPIAGWKRAVLNVFIGLHVFALFFWGLPDGPFRNRMIKPVEKYFVFSGLWHTWTMFAPMPLIVHFDVRGEVKYRDGSVAEWIAPRMEDLSIWDRVRKERFRKWREKVRTNDYRAVWPETARFIAREMNRRPDNPPVQVKLIRKWVDLPKPNPRSDFQTMPEGYNPTNSYAYYTAAIRPEDLK